MSKTNLTATVVDPFQQSDGQPIYTIDEFVNSNRGLTRAQIVTQRRNRSFLANSQPGGPRLRYVRNPRDGRVIDMRHMLIVGPEGPVIGLGIEIFQWATLQPSGMNPQDFYSNDLGLTFNGYLRLYKLRNPLLYTEYLRNFFYTNHYYNKK